MRKLLVRSIVAMVLFHCASRADAIGWDSNDFLISGGPQGPAQIGVFDYDPTFKGFLEPGWSRGGGWEFDARGNFVANSPGHSEVRVYSPSGTTIGGFFDNRLAASSDLRIAPDGTYIIGEGDDFGLQGIVQFTPTGGFIRQYGSGDLAHVDIVGDSVWAGRLGDPQVKVFDLATGAQRPSFTVNGLSGVQAIHYSASSNTVMFGHSSLGRIIETDLMGNVIRTFQGPTGVSIIGITRGPNGDVFGTTGESIWQWSAQGQFLRSVSGAQSLGNVSTIAWAGSVPEPAIAAILSAGMPTLLGRRRVSRPVGEIRGTFLLIGDDAHAARRSEPPICPRAKLRG